MCAGGSTNPRGGHVLIVLILLLVFWPLVVELVLALVAGLVSTVAKKEVLGGAIILLSLAIIAIAIVGCGKALEWSEDTITYTTCGVLCVITLTLKLLGHGGQALVAQSLHGRYVWQASEQEREMFEFLCKQGKMRCTIYGQMISIREERQR
jgi:hypothetical protein